ncbi:MAG: N-acetyltransferase [Candidatus Marinimicrobia bacterium]|nr:N-acetyltransferase [Candidatus Neomarinimicrobiota bacterium]
MSIINTLSYRVAKNVDLSVIVEIYNSIIDEKELTADLSRFTVKDKRSWFLSHSATPYQLYVVERSATIVGYFYFSPWRSGREALGGTAEVSYYLQKESRRKGIGRYILQQAIRIARENGLINLLAILLDINIPSMKLLESEGFVIVGRIPNIAVINDKVCGQLLMIKPLIA